MRAFLTIAMLLACLPCRAADQPADNWVEATRAVHQKFHGKPGTFAHFGDSITVTKAFWSGLQWDRKNLDPEAKAAFERVNAYMNKSCWGDWKGPQYGSEGGKTADWAADNVDRWLKELNPECALILFGTNDLNHLPIDQYESNMRAVIKKCLDNGTVVILTTIPPRHGMLEKARQYADVDRKLAGEFKLPLIDLQGEILHRRPDDWDGAEGKYKDQGYDAETLISGDGVHPSAPGKYAGDYSEQALKCSGYNLRTYLTLLSYDRVIQKVLK